MGIKELLEEKFGDKVSFTVDKHNEAWINIPLDLLRDVLKALREAGFDHLSTITGYDDGEKINLIYHVVKFYDGKSETVNVITSTDRNNSVAPSILEIYPSALVYEREVYDLLGVKFDGHVGLKRLLLPENVPEGYHPLRKDFKSGSYLVSPKEGENE